MSSKPRPPNAAGPNGLRGGIKQFQPKTITGPWLEELGGPAGYKRGFTNADYETEAQHQQLGAFKQKFPDFGAGLPDEIQLNRPTSPFKYENTKYEVSPWLTNTMLMGLNTTTRKSKDEEENNVYNNMLKPKYPPDKIDEYRKTWTTDSVDAARKMRFTTETKNALNHGTVHTLFQIESVRPLPGTPKSFEKFREILLQKYGVLSFMVLKYYFYCENKQPDLTPSEFKRVIQRLNVDVKAHDLNQMVAYITPSSTSIPTDKFIYTLKGNMSSFMRDPVSQLFQRIDSSVGNSRLTVSDIVSAIDGRNYPELLEGFSKFLVAYSRNINEFYREEESGSVVIGSDDFLDCMQDLYAASVQLYEESMKQMWKV